MDKLLGENYSHLFPTICGDITIRYGKKDVFIYDRKLKKTLNGNKDFAYLLEQCTGEKELNEIFNSLSSKYQKIKLKSESISIINRLQEEGIIELKNKPSNRVIKVRYQDFTSPLDTVYLELTKRCNSNCIHCYASSPSFSKNSINKNEIFTDDWKRVIDKLDEIGVINICFTGGEPFIHKDFIDILKYTNSKGLEIGIFTNGTLINSYDNSILLELQPKFIAVSLYSHIPKIYSKITGIDKCEIVLNNLKELKSNKLPAIVNCVLFEGINNTYSHLTGFIKTLTEIGLKPEQITFDEFCPEGEGQFLNNLVVDEQKTMTTLSHAFKDVCNVEYKQNSVDTMHESLISFCGIGVNMFYITGNGDIALCPALTNEKHISGNALLDNISKVWDDSEIFYFFRKQEYLRNSPCKTCEKLFICQAGCRAKSETFFNSIYNVDPWMCAFFERNINLKNKSV